MSGPPDVRPGERALRILVVLGALSGALAVAAGAFGAHALAGAVTPARLETWRTGATYHLAHAPAVAAAALLARGLGRGARAARAAGRLFLVGTALFSGSLYALVLADLPVMGAVAPLGGGAFIAGWLALAWGAWKG